MHYIQQSQWPACPPPLSATVSILLKSLPYPHDKAERRTVIKMQVEGTTLQDLLRRPPADVAQWVVQQAEALSAPGARVQNLEIFQVAGALSTAPVEQKQELMKNAISGFGRLPATQRAEVLRFAVSTAAVAGSSRRGDVDELTRNVGVLVKEAKIDQMPPAEKRQLAQEIQQDAAELVQPQQLIEVVAELKPEERERMTEALIEAKLVPEEHKGVLEEAMRPGGSADKLVAALKMWTLVEEYALAIVALPFLELLLALVFGGLSCDSGLSAWLRADAWFSCLMMGGGWFCHLQMAPVLQAARQDPLALAQRWQQHQDLPVSRRLEQLVPGVEIGAYQLGAVGAAAAVIFLLIGLANTIVGLMELLGTLVMGCAIFVVLVSMFFIAVRCATFVGILAAAKYVLTEMQALGLDGYTSEDPLLHGGAFNRAPLQP